MGINMALLDQRNDHNQSRASDSERGFGSPEQVTYLAGPLWTHTWLDPCTGNFQKLLRDAG